MDNIKNECEHKRLTTYDLLEQMRTQGDLGMYIGFAKEAIFHILFECAITVYSMELIAMLSRFFIKDITKIQNPLLLIFLPSFLVILVTLYFILHFIRLFLFWVQDYSKSTDDKIQDLISNKGELIDALKKIHVAGRRYYTILPIAISIYLSIAYTKSINNWISFIAVITVIGFVLGYIWNKAGYYRDKRFFLAKLIERSKHNNSQAAKELFCLTWNNVKWNFYSIVILLINCVVIILFPNENILKPMVLLQLTTDYNFIIVLYILLITVYLRNEAKLLYPQTGDKTSLFPSITFILGKRN